jgi:replicative DNA helicase
MSKQHIIDKFTFDNIFAGLFRLMQEPALLNRYIKYIDPEWFFPKDFTPKVRALRIIINTLKDMYEREKTGMLTIPYFQTYLATHSSDGRDVQEAQQLFNEMRHNEEVINKSRDRGCFEIFLEYLKIITMAAHAVPMADSYNRGYIEDAAEHMSKALAEIKQISFDEIQTFDPANLVNYLKGNDESSYLHPLWFGCEPMDQAINGFFPQTLNLFISVTNGGKSAMAHHLIRECIRQKQKVHVTCVEDRQKSFSSKLVAGFTGIPTKRLNSTKFDDLSSDEQDQIYKVQEKIANYLWVDFAFGLSVEAIHQRKIDYDLECKSKGLLIPRVDIVDYTGHVASASRGEKTYEQLRNAYAARKDFALKHNKIAFDFAQVNRLGNQRLAADEDLTQADLAGSYDLSQVCDNIISINRNRDLIQQQKAYLYISKARDGEVGGKFKVGTDFASNRWIMNDCVVMGARPVDHRNTAGETNVNLEETLNGAGRDE